MTNKEKEYTDIEATLGNLDNAEDDSYLPDSLSPAICSCCGNRLSVDEWEEFEDTCEECMWNETSGLIDDNTEDELT